MAHIYIHTCAMTQRPGLDAFKKRNAGAFSHSFKPKGTLARGSWQEVHWQEAAPPESQRCWEAFVIGRTFSVYLHFLCGRARTVARFLHDVQSLKAPSVRGRMSMGMSSSSGLLACGWVCGYC